MSKKRLIIPVAILGLTLPLMALSARPVGQRTALRKELNLTPAQVSQWKTIVQANKSQRQDVRQNVRQKAQSLRDLTAKSNPDPTEVGNALLGLKQVRRQAQEMRKQNAEKLKGILTPDQIKTFDALQAKRKGQTAGKAREI